MCFTVDKTMQMTKMIKHCRIKDKEHFNKNNKTQHLINAFL